MININILGFVNFLMLSHPCISEIKLTLVRLFYIYMIKFYLGFLLQCLKMKLNYNFIYCFSFLVWVLGSHIAYTKLNFLKNKLSLVNQLKLHCNWLVGLLILPHPDCVLPT